MYTNRKRSYTGNAKFTNPIQRIYKANSLIVSSNKYLNNILCRRPCDNNPQQKINGKSNQTHKITHRKLEPNHKHQQIKIHESYQEEIKFKPTPN